MPTELYWVSIDGYWLCCTAETRDLKKRKIATAHHYGLQVSEMPPSGDITWNGADYLSGDKLEIIDILELNIATPEDVMRYLSIKTRDLESRLQRIERAQRSPRIFPS